MKWIWVVMFLVTVFVFSGCQQREVTIEKHRSEHLHQEISTDQAIQESQAMGNSPDKIDSGPMEVHRETIIEKVESEEVVIE